jgi:hypothetical protein
MLIRLIYASRSAEPVTPAVIESIVAQSRHNNAEAGVTGVLCHSGDAFMQVLEGGRAEVNAIYNAIVRDSRHRDVTLIACEEIVQRRFSNWSMGRVNLGRVNASILLKYGKKPVFDPYTVRGSVALAFLEELMATAQVA